MNPVYLERKAVGKNNEPYFIAEIGGNFRTEQELITLVDDAVDAGADAVKFQTLEADTITTKDNYFFFNDTPPVSQYENFVKGETPKELQKFAFQYANEKKITVFSAPSHMKDVEFMEEHLKTPIYKIGSDLCCHTPLLKEVARLQKPVILSTGLTGLDEVRHSVETILNEGNEQLILMHCVSNYPCKPSEVNLNAMLTLKKEFGLPTGYSDHSLDIEISLAAVALGADIIERHFTFDKSADGPDHILSSTKDEFKRLIEWSKNINQALGSFEKQPAMSELEYRPFNRVGINTIKDIKAGEIITEEHVDVRRPARGIRPQDWDLVIGQKAKNDIAYDQPLFWNDINTLRND